MHGDHRDSSSNIEAWTKVIRSKMVSDVRSPLLLLFLLSTYVFFKTKTKTT